MRNRDKILKILDRFDLLESVSFPEHGLLAFADQTKNDLLLMLIGGLMKIGFDDKKGLDKFIYHTPRGA